MSLGDAELWGQGLSERAGDPSCGPHWSLVPLRTVTSEVSVKFLGTIPAQSLTICCSFEQAEVMERKRGLLQCAPSYDLTLPH